jgi:hypothetical protein
MNPLRIWARVYQPFVVIGDGFFKRLVHLFSMNLAALPSVEKLSQQLAKQSQLPKSLVTGFVKRHLTPYREHLMAGETEFA